MKIVVIDGQGGKIGSLLIEKIKAVRPDAEICAIGSNSHATAAMLKAGGDYGATGENPVVVNCRDADLITGPIGIIAANSLFGEITPLMALAVSESPARKLLLPVNKCNITVAGTEKGQLSDHLKFVAETVKQLEA